VTSAMAGWPTAGSERVQSGRWIGGIKGRLNRSRVRKWKGRRRAIFGIGDRRLITPSPGQLSADANQRLREIMGKVVAKPTAARIAVADTDGLAEWLYGFWPPMVKAPNDPPYNAMNSPARENCCS